MTYSSIATRIVVAAIAFPVGAAVETDPTAIQTLSNRAVELSSTDKQTQWLPPTICKFLPNLAGCEKHRPHSMPV